ncbi:hypothetical protein KN815_18370 [Streptomyces sp. 4503]|uniref:Lipoprotein n=1 Tax=Streptomyces niphimycinicus TaxID=2842201 RepID=A0ABS6CGB7_9ACTN|nr:hypothetical protein [Streptomyces niphimycinicus]MBU3865968.1 hypothetical protein [Streptomyces niphimycinicus]
MIHLRHNTLRREKHQGAAKLAKTSIAVFTLITVLAGCSQDKRQYTVPSTLCGINKKEEPVRTHLPAGQKDQPAQAGQVDHRNGRARTM